MKLPAIQPKKIKFFNFRLRIIKFFFQGSILILIIGFLSSYRSASDPEIEVIDVNRVLHKYQPIPKMVYPQNNPWSREKEEFWEMLFFDPSLSGDNKMSCSTCHKPEMGFSDGRPRSIGNNKKKLGRNSISMINSGYFNNLMWDGRYKSLEEQVFSPIILADEMNQDPDKLTDELRSIPGYVKRFKNIFGKEGITPNNIAKAIASFERSTISSNAPPMTSIGKARKAQCLIQPFGE